MKKFLLIMLLSIFCLNAKSQISSLGLENMIVTNIKLIDNVLYASTKDSGVFRHAISDTEWTSLGLREKNIRSIYLHPTGASSAFSFTAGVIPNWYASDSTVIYGLTDHGWVAADNGIGYCDGINSVCGTINPLGDHIMYAAGCDVYKQTNGNWNKIFNCAWTNILEISPNRTIYIGGVTVFEMPFFAKSNDEGITWNGFVDTSNIGYFYSFAFNPIDPNITYAGSGGKVWRTLDGGITWDSLLLAAGVGQTLALDPYMPNHLFAGAYCGDSALLYETSDGGANWQKISLPEGTKGILDLEIGFKDSLDLYISTNGSGVYRLTQPTSVFFLKVDSDWNMISIPRKTSDYRKSTLFPKAISSAFFYDGTYISIDTLQNEKGYWLKFDQQCNIGIAGDNIVADTIVVKIGWNMIGSISLPVPVESISSNPPGIIVTGFYTYKNNQYELSDTIQPGCAYWVKTNQVGELIIDTSSSHSRMSTVKIIPDGELPPPPPLYESTVKNFPTDFRLEHNFPNPFNTTTTLRYALSKDANVSLRIYDVLGREVAIVVNEKKQAGEYTVQWSDEGLPSGVYFYRINAGNFSDVKKLLLIR